MKADLHIHSTFSDGISSPEEIVEAAIDNGIKCISIVDHEEVSGSIRAMKFGFDKDILVVPGIEISSKAGDILAINVRKNIPDRLSAEETVKEIRKQNGLVVIPHPFHWPTNHFRGDILSIMPDALEVFNASCVYKLANQKAFDFTLENNMAFTAGSDAHRADFVGRGYIELLKDVSSEKELLEEIMNKRVKVNGDKLNYWEIFRNFSQTDLSRKIRV